MPPRGRYCPVCARRVYLAQRADGTRLLVTSIGPPGAPWGQVHCTPAPLTRAQRRQIVRHNRR